MGGVVAAAGGRLSKGGIDDPKQKSGGGCLGDEERAPARREGPSSVDDMSDVSGPPAIPHVEYASDWFHHGNHTDPWCLETCAPDAPRHKELLAGVRTSVCEFTFTWLSRYKHSTKHMKQFGFLFYIFQMVDLHNEMISRGNSSHLPEAKRSTGARK